MKIAFITGGSRIHGGSLSEAALGGSETALIQAAQSLAKLGHRVTVITDCPFPGESQGVVYEDISTLYSPQQGDPEPVYDTIIISRTYQLIERVQALAGPDTFIALWLHDILDNPPSLAPRLKNLDLIFCLSRFHLEDTARRLPGSRSKLALTKNGLDLDLIGRTRAENRPRNKKRMVYASRPERGLRVLLEDIWPVLRAAIPEIELAVCGYEADKSSLDTGLLQEYQALDELAESLEGVELKGGLAKKEYYRLLASSGLLLYPCTFGRLFFIEK